MGLYNTCGAGNLEDAKQVLNSIPADQRAALINQHLPAHIVGISLNWGFVIFSPVMVQTQSKSTRTALMQAAYKGHIDVVSYLIDMGGDIEARDEVRLRLKQSQPSLFLLNPCLFLSAVISLLHIGVGLEQLDGFDASML
jgi:ankyrin repeat protein